MVEELPHFLVNPMPAWLGASFSVEDVEIQSDELCMNTWLTTVFVTFMSLETLGVFWFRSLGTLRPACEASINS